MITLHVTDLDSLVWYRRIEDMTKEEMIARLLRTSKPEGKMLIGTAWHKVMENPPDVIDSIEQDGFVFNVDCDATINIPQVREIRATKIYNVDGMQVRLTGGCDGITGNMVKDHKLSFNPNPESYFDSFQWRAYLDIYSADVFEYILYHAAGEGNEITIKDVYRFNMYRYPGMIEDLERGIYDLLQFIKSNVPQMIQ